MTNRQKLFVLGSIVAFIAIVFFLSPILMPFLVGALLAYLTDPIVEKLEHWGMPRVLAVVIVMSLFFVVLILGVMILYPLLQNQILTLIDMIPLGISYVNEKVLPVIRDYVGVELTKLDVMSVKTFIQEQWQAVGTWTAQILKTVSNSALSIILWLTNVFLIPVVMFYLLRDWHLIIDAIQKILPRPVEPTIGLLTMQCDEVLGSFIRGQLLVMFILGVIYSIGLTLVGTPLSILIGMLSGLFSIVPYLGFAVGISTALIAAMIQYHDLYHIIGVLVVFGIGQILESSLLTPVLVGDKIGLHPVAVIFAILTGGHLFGFVGVLLALPISAVIMVLLRYAYYQYLQSSFYNAS